MSAPDIVNGLFEVLGGLTTALNIRALMRDKEVKGVDWRLTFFYTAWGLWNLFYYPHLGQWASFAGGVVIVAGNAVWLALVITYRRRAARKARRQASCNCGAYVCAQCALTGPP